MQAMQRGGPHLQSLTTFRFFAAIAVVMYHLYLYISPLTQSLAAFSYGFTGVSFFFILSGFVLTWSYGNGYGSKKFYWNRFARVWPLHALMTFIAILAPAFNAPTTVWSALPFVLTLTQSWLPIGGYLATFNGVAWSLSDEAFFYLLFPVMFNRLSRCRRIPSFALTLGVGAAIVGILVLLSIPPGAANYFLGTVPLYRIAEFALGMCTAIMFKRGWRPRLSLSCALGISIAAYFSLILASFLFFGAPGSIPVTIANLTMMPGFLAIISAGAARDLSGKFEATPPRLLVRLGQWSFALYLVHELVIRFIRPLISHMGTVADLVVALGVVIFSIALSALLHEFFEKPLERLLRSWAASKYSVSVATARQRVPASDVKHNYDEFSGFPSTPRQCLEPEGQTSVIKPKQTAEGSF